MKTWTIALKDTLVAFRDRNAILLMIAAPLLIALVMGLAFGGQADDTSPIHSIPIVVVNEDEGELGRGFTEILAGIEVDTSEGRQPLFLIRSLDNLPAAQGEIEAGEARGVVHIPAGFTAGLESRAGEGGDRNAVSIQVLTDPTASISPAIVRSVVDRIATGYSTVAIGNVVAVELLLETATDIPVLFVNDDDGPVSGAADEAFAPDAFEGLFALEAVDDLAAAESRLAAGEVAAVIHIEPGFSAAVISGAGPDDVTARVAVLGDPFNLSYPIVRDVTEAVAAGFSASAESGGLEKASPVLRALDDLEAILAVETAGFGETEGARDRIRIASGSAGEGESVNLLNYFVPSMAIFFLMFAVFDGTRSILEEERDGTLHRLMTTPTGRAEIILGKIGGTFLTGILQFAVLVLISGVVFRVDWGREPLGMVLLVLATVSAATSLGAFLASFARNASQAGVVGSAVALVFAILGGNFIDFRAIPDWLAPLSKATINRWALEGFVNMTLGGQSLTGAIPNILVLFGMAAVFFSLSLIFFNRRFVG